MTHRAGPAAGSPAGSLVVIIRENTSPGSVADSGEAAARRSRDLKNTAASAHPAGAGTAGCTTAARRHMPGARRAGSGTAGSRAAPCAGWEEYAARPFLEVGPRSRARGCHGARYYDPIAGLRMQRFAYSAAQAACRTTPAAPSMMAPDTRPPRRRRPHPRQALK